MLRVASGCSPNRRLINHNIRLHYSGISTGSVLPNLIDLFSKLLLQNWNDRLVHERTLSDPETPVIPHSTPKGLYCKVLQIVLLRSDDLHESMVFFSPGINLQFSERYIQSELFAIFIISVGVLQQLSDTVNTCPGPYL